jgi:large subunit ribosomal protein L28
MAQECEVCGKRAAVGNQVTTRGKAKYLGGVGTKITGISRRQFRPNLQRVRVTTANGTHKTIRVCAQCIRSGAVTKTIRNAPFKLPPGETASKSKGEKPESGKKAKKK